MGMGLDAVAFKQFESYRTGAIVGVSVMERVGTRLSVGLVDFQKRNRFQ